MGCVNYYYALSQSIEKVLVGLHIAQPNESDKNLVLNNIFVLESDFEIKLLDPHCI